MRLWKVVCQYKWRNLMYLMIYLCTFTLQPSKISSNTEFNI